ncbi:MAG: AbrB/MazE/SpoVT family DNA-binding domain-containing protein [Chloroflexi bacterium]|nr:AbrB/MazE/SpoVT family DNA-binding domain-containing protein [Chloroflexota bacterium]
MASIKTKIGEGGRVVVPAKYRKALDLKPGDDVILVLEDGEVRITTLPRVIQRAQEMVRRYNPEGRSLVDELIQERRDEANRE